VQILLEFACIGTSMGNGNLPVFPFIQSYFAIIKDIYLVLKLLIVFIWNVHFCVPGRPFLRSRTCIFFVLKRSEKNP